MPYNSKLARRILVIGLSVVAGLAAALWTYDLSQDHHRYKIVIAGPVELYSDPELAAYPWLGGNPLQRLRPGEPVQVKRISHGKDYLAIKVQTAEGISGWVIRGQNVKLIRPRDNQ